MRLSLGALDLGKMYELQVSSRFATKLSNSSTCFFPDYRWEKEARLRRTAVENVCCYQHVGFNFALVGQRRRENDFAMT
jgi:hypothetical protein